MSNQASAFALRNAVTEIQNVCPEVTNTFIFGENGEVVAQDQKTTPNTISNVHAAFRSLAEKSSVLGDVESISFKGQKARANISHFQDFYITNVASTEADEKTVTNLTRIMIPTMLRLVEQMYSSQSNPREVVRTPERELLPVSTPEAYAAEANRVRSRAIYCREFRFRVFLKR